MPSLSPNLAGRVFPPTTYLVGREKVREFARALRSTNPLHHDVGASRAAGFADVIAPTTFTTVVQSPAVMQLVQTPDTGLDPSRVVHGSEKIEHQRPIVAGDDLATTLTITDVTERAGNTILSTVCEIHDETGELVATVTSTLLCRGGVA
ncbi:MaoC family dehydratase N-terminal domain-containing protein [Rhodococcus sp. NPDC059234]|uniref:FAS1-like dehydratase domain-containing protein n=1 Tax=Rhodococcus sp. NPDC059234 TaxID=3346781 RepID=UPI00367195FC